MTIEDLKSGSLYVIGANDRNRPLWAKFGRQGWTWCPNLLDAEAFDTKERADAHRLRDRGLKEAKSWLDPKVHRTVETLKVTMQWRIEGC